MRIKYVSGYPSYVSAWKRAQTANAPLPMCGDQFCERGLTGGSVERRYRHRQASIYHAWLRGEYDNGFIPHPTNEYSVAA